MRHLEGTESNPRYLEGTGSSPRCLESNGTSPVDQLAHLDGLGDGSLKLPKWSSILDAGAQFG